MATDREDMLPMPTKIDTNLRLRSASIGFSSPAPVAVPSLIVESMDGDGIQGSSDSSPSQTTTTVRMPSPYGSKELIIIKEDEIMNMGRNRFLSRMNAVPKNVREDREGTRIIVATPDSHRKYVPLRKGRSLMDWIRLSNSTPDLSGTEGRFLDISEVELQRHNKINDAWICLKGKVYNITPYLEYHPGGTDILMTGVGKDATEMFYQTHKWVNFEAMLQKCLVGRLVTARAPIAKLEHRDKEIQKKRRLPSSSRGAKLASKLRLNHNTFLFSLELDKPPRMFVPVASHVLLTLVDPEGNKIARSFTPVPKNLLENDLNLDKHVHIAIKIYKDGKFTTLLNKLEIGDPIEISDHFGHFSVDRLKTVTCFVGIAGGTGITPILGIIYHIFVKSQLKYNIVKVLYFVNEEKDFIFKEELDALSQRKSNFEIEYIVNHPTKQWRGHHGKASYKVLAELVPACEKLISICGPTDFNFKCCNLFDEMRIDSSEIFLFSNDQVTL